MYNLFIYLLLGVLVIASILLVLLVLMQRPKSEGLGASFGGGMTQDLFGAQTTSVLQKFTVYLGGAFFAVSLLLTILYSKSSTRDSKVIESITADAAKKPAVSGTTTPAPANAAASPAAVSTETPASESVPAESAVSPQ